MIICEVRGVKELEEKIKKFGTEIDNADISQKGANQIVGSIRRQMTFSNIDRFKSRTLWNAFQAEKIDKKNSKVFIPEGTKEPSGLPTDYLVTTLNEGRLTHGWHFVPMPGFGRHGEGYMKPGGYHYIKGRHFLEAGLIEGIKRVGDVADVEVQGCLRRSFT